MKIKDNTILLIPNEIKDKVLKELDNNFLNIKLLTFNELKKSLIFDYNDETIYYIMNKLNVGYEIAKEHLNNLYFIEDKDYSEDKLLFLKNLKDDLDLNNKLIYDKLFINLVKNYEYLMVYNFDYLSKYDKYLLDKLKDIIKIEIIDKEYQDYKHSVYEFNSLYDELTYVGEEISKLIKQGVSIDKIYISNYKEDNDFVLKHIFNLYNIPYYITSNSNLYKSPMGKYFIDNLNSDINITLKDIEDKFDLNNEYNKEVYDKIISILNNYTFISDKTLIKDILSEAFKNKKLNNNHYKYEIKNINLINNLILDDEYVFLIGFDNTFPTLKKDEDYINDKIKPYYMESVNEYNKNIKEVYRNIIKNIKNITITYKKYHGSNNYLKSSLIDNDYLFIEEKNNTYSNYSDKVNKIILGKKIDNLIKYNNKDDVLDILYNNYEIDYKNYDHSFKDIDNSFLLKNIDNNLNFSYSNISSYYECPFKFYVQNILKINEFETKFTTYIGSLFHYVLEKCLDNSLDIDETYYEYVKNNEFDFSNKDKFFLDNLLEELHFIIETIRKQYTYSSHKDTLKEQKIELEINEPFNTKIKGFIDKMLINDNDIVIIDYKTGSINIDKAYFEYGMYLQLPIYIYLIKNYNKDYNIVGIYLQHILNTKSTFKEKLDIIKDKESKLKLDGLTLEDKNKIKIFDNSYEDSEVINKLKLKKDGDFSNKKIMLSYDDIDNLYNLVDKLIKDCINNVSKGVFPINPIKVEDKIDGCKFCDYKDICFKDIRDFNYKEVIKEGDNNESYE